MWSNAMIRYILIIILIYTCVSYSQEAFYFGVNADVANKDFQKILVDSITNYGTLCKNFNLNVFRFPGGNEARSYIWNNISLTKEAAGKYYQYLREVNPDKYNEAQRYINKFDINSTYYRSFLEFCNRNNVIPLIQLNTDFFGQGDRLFQIKPFTKLQVTDIQENSWPTILDSLKNQIKFSHKIVNKIIWEIGNEDYFMYKPLVYADIVIKFAKTIKRLYPGDKVCVSMAHSFWGKNNMKNWNIKLVGYLASQDFLKNIDYFSPHFYYHPDQPINNYEQAIDRIKATDFSGFVNDKLSYFPPNYNPKLFITEFSPLLKSYTNPAYNTQLHALMMFYYLFNFVGLNNVDGVINHAFEEHPAGIFFLNGFVLKKDTLISDSSEVFKYISPEAKAISLLFKYTNGQKLDLKAFSNYLALQSTNPDHKKILILNFSKTDVRIDLNTYYGKDYSGRITGSYYSLDNLRSYYWKPEEKTLSGILEGKSIAIPGLSFAYINIE